MNNRVNLLSDRVAFLEEVYTGPEVGGGGLEEVYECFCEVYEPSMKDATVLNASTNKQTVTLTIRNAPFAFKPRPHHQFKVKSGFFEGELFNIKTIVPYSNDNSYLKIVGEGA